MKFLLKIAIGLILLNYSADANIINAQEYVDDLMKNFITNLEKTEITGNGLPITDWSASINTSQYDVTALGMVKFHSGFVNSIEKPAVDNRTTKTAIFDDYLQIEATFYFENVRIFYDMEIELKDYTDLGNILILVPKITFIVKLVHHFKTNIRTFEIMQEEAFDITKLERKVYPYNGYTQLINQQLSPTNPDFYNAFRQSVAEGWKEPMQKYLDTTSVNAKYPEICYYCINELEL